MKEQRGELGPSKESVTEETIGDIHKECLRIFETDGRVRVRVDTSDDRDREGYDKDKKRLLLTVTNHAAMAYYNFLGGFQGGGKWVIDTSSRSSSSYRGNVDAKGLARCDIEITDEQKDIRYTYALAYGRFNGFRIVHRPSFGVKESNDNIFLLFFLKPWWVLRSNFSLSQKEEINRLLSQGQKVGKVIYDGYLPYGLKELPDTPYYGIYMPNETNAKSLLNSLRNTKQVRAIPNSIEF